MIEYGQPEPGLPDRGYVLYITALVMVLVAAVFVFLRLASRFWTAKMGVDDITIIMALICSSLLTAMINLAVVHGYGRPVSYLSTEQKHAAFMWFFIAQVFYKMTLGFTKISIILLYLRIFITGTFKRVAYVFLVMITIWTIGTIMATIFQCVPVRASWDLSVKHPRCINKDAFWYAFAATDTITDFAVFLLPLKPIFGLHLPRREKLGLLAVFGIGAFVCVTSIIRTVAVSQTSAKQLDISWDFIPRSTWTLVEANMGIICSCLPMMRAPLARLFPRLFHASTYGRSSGLNDGHHTPYGLDSLRRRSKPPLTPVHHNNHLAIYTQSEVYTQSQEHIIDEEGAVDYNTTASRSRRSSPTDLLGRQQVQIKTYIHVSGPEEVDSPRG